jgi:hypothetical protein
LVWWLFLNLIFMKIFFLTALLLTTVTVFAQDKPLSLDESGKLIYYEVVEAKTVPRDSLKQRLDAFLKAEGKALKIKSKIADSILQAAGKIIIRKTALVLSRPSGEVLYDFYAEVKDGKYRFWLTDFNFIPYERDRYSNFVPATNIGVPLERKPGKLNAGEWDTYVKTTTRDVNAFAIRFKAAMQQKTPLQPVMKAVPVISTKKW